ncbi:MAG TPA: PadR family transcriptional regulator [Longimicrobiales bacterium]|jgi:transcriptional regulator
MADASLALLKGTLDVLILETLRRGPLHGYGISRWLRVTTEEAFSVEEGALYPALRRLDKKGFVESRWGETDTGREAKFYELTPAGRTELEASVTSWRRYAQAMARVLEAPTRG